MTQRIDNNGKENIAKLLHDTESSLVERCIPAAKALADRGIQEVIPILKNGVSNYLKYGPPKTAKKVRRVFLECLAKLGDSETVIECLHTSRNNEPWLVELLGKYPGSTGINELLRIVQDAATGFVDRWKRVYCTGTWEFPPSYEITGSAIRSLKKLNEARAKTALYTLLTIEPKNFIQPNVFTDPDFGVSRIVGYIDDTSTYNRLCRGPAAQALAKLNSRELLEEALLATKNHPSIQDIIISALSELERSTP